jgi:cell division protein FtsW (lipid II flippase)
MGPGLGNGFLIRGDGSYTVPVLPTDFIFTALATELGFVGGVGLLLAFVVFLQRGFAIAAAAGDGFSKLLAAGLTAAVALQALLIVGGVVRLVPLTGVTLPFVSYGGSSVLTNFAIVALLLIISHRSQVGARAPRRARAARRSLVEEAAAGE